MKVIDLLQRIANGEIHYSRKFRFSHKDYCTATQFFERYIVDKENLNLEIKELEDTPKEDKKIKRIEERESGWWPNSADGNVSTLKQAINEIIDKINGDGNE